MANKVQGKRNLGNLLKTWRLKHDLTLRDLANEIGISHTTLMRIEEGRNCDATTFYEIMGRLFKEVEPQTNKS